MSEINGFGETFFDEVRQALDVMDSVPFQLQHEQYGVVEVNITRIEDDQLVAYATGDYVGEVRLNADGTYSGDIAKREG